MPKKPTTVKVTPANEPTPKPDDEVKAPVPEQPAIPPKPNVVKAPQVGKKRWPNWVWWAIGGGVVLIAATILGWTLFGSAPAATETNTAPTNTNTNTETLVPRTLDGVPVASDKANTNIYAVVIENIVEARPQSALDRASVVYETLAEGGITRFLALYPVGESIDKIGPVRSARPYFVSWSEEYKALFVHAGGSPQALDYLRSGRANVYDFNQFSNGGNFIRDASRKAPHNLYTDTNKLFAGLRRRAPDAKPNYTSWPFKGETPLDSRPQTVNDLVIDFSSFSYRVKYVYDRVQNRYQRYQADKPHLMLDGAQVYAKDIAVQFTSIGPLAGEKQRLDIKTIGSGKLLLFRDGTVTEGTWKKSSASARTEWLDASGNALSLNPGPIWIETVATSTKVTY